MSSIILSNPFVTPPPAPQAATEGLIVPTAVTAVSPAKSGSDARGAGDASTYGGTGSGRGRSIGSASQQAVLSQRQGALNMDRPPNATANSVVGAQSSSTPSITPQPDTRDVPLLSVKSETGENVSPLEADMPDPLPTSPFLKMMSGRD